MDYNPLLPSILPFLSYFLLCKILLLAHNSEFSNALSWDTRLWSFLQATLDVIPLYYGLRIINGPKSYYRQNSIIASRLRAVIDTNVREMDNVLASMELWESRSCPKVDGHSNGEDTMTRLGSFLKAMESPDLTDKIYEMKGLSNHLNIVTKRLIRSQLLVAMDLMITRNVFWDLYLYVISVSEG